MLEPSAVHRHYFNDPYIKSIYTPRCADWQLLQKRYYNHYSVSKSNIFSLLSNSEIIESYRHHRKHWKKLSICIDNHTIRCFLCCLQNVCLEKYI